MVKVNIYNRLRNDIFAGIYPDLCLVRMLESGNINDHLYSIEKHCHNYNARYSITDFDIFKKKSLFFTSYSGSSGNNLLNFIDCVLNDDIKNLVNKDKFAFQNIRSCLFEIKNIYIIETEVDDTLIYILKKYFPHVEEISFSQCTIKSSCNFSDIDVSLVFSNCTIENIRSFNDCHSNIKLDFSSIEKIVPTSIFSKRIEIFGNPSFGIDRKKLFLCCNFPELLDFEIRIPFYESFSFQDDFIFLPYSAPNLENLLLQGKVSSLDFLTKFKKLVSITILSASDDLGLFSTVVTNCKERKKIVERNRERYEIQKLLDPDEKDESIIGNLERNRIYNLCNFLSIISCDDEDIKFYMNKKMFDTDNKLNGYLEDYYDCYGTKLYHRLTRVNDFLEYYSEISNNPGYQLIDNILYLKQGKIILPKNFIYHINGKPIVFCGKLKEIDTIEEAKRKNSSPIKFSLDESIYNDFIECLRNYSFDSITVGEMIDWINETVDYHINGKEFLNFGEYGRKIAYIFDTYYRSKQRLSFLIDKSKNCDDVILELIKEVYDKLSLLEKIYLYLHKDDYSLPENNDFIKTWFFKIYNISCENDDEVLKSINKKMNGLYLKYINQKKLIYNQYYCDDMNPYNIEINSDYIKKLDLSKNNF